MNRPASAYFNNHSNNSNVMNLSSPSTPNIPNAQSTSTGNLMGFNQINNSISNNNNNSINNNMMPSPAQHAHISHPNLGGMSNASSSITNSPITTHRPPMMPKMQQQQQQAQQQMGGNFMRDTQSQLSLRLNQQQQQMMAPSMPNIAHASGYASNIPASQSMQNVNQIPGNYTMYHPQQQQAQPQFQDPNIQYQQNPQLSPNHQAALMRGTAKIAEMSELIKRQQRNQQMPTNGPIHFANSMDNISIPPNPMLSPGAHRNPPQQNAYHPQSPQKLAPNTAPKPQVVFIFFFCCRTCLLLTFWQTVDKNLFRIFENCSTIRN
jgi:hypothetical protein